MQTLLAVAAGGAIGASARYLLSREVARWFGSGFPWGTLAVNVLGAAAMGLLIGLFARVWPVQDPWRAFLTTGILGGFTTFSAFSLDAMTLIERGDYATAALYVVASVVLSIAAVAIGLAVIRSFS